MSSLKYRQILQEFCESYRQTAEDPGGVLEIFQEEVEKAAKNPIPFPPYHRKERAPFDYYKFGLDFIRPLIDKKSSQLLGEPYFQEIEKLLARGENAILLANHQTEADPQAIAVLLEDSFPSLGEAMIFVAGERVVTDPLAIPLSRGCDLLCIYSKRYIDHPPEEKLQKQLHNKNTMELMSELLAQGGKLIYVAPSGGRDRKTPSGSIEVAPFDPASVEMFHLMAKRAKVSTHFYPLTLATFDLLPPPETIQKELGEKRTVQRSSIQIALSDAVDLEAIDQKWGALKRPERRQKKAQIVFEIVQSTYQRIHPCA